MSETFPQEVPSEQRRAALGQAVAREVSAGGWRIESQTDQQAVLVKGKDTNHVLHLIISLVSCGLWLFVWPILWYLNQRKTLILSVDAYGNVLRQG